jgi:hypothetical protein
MRYNEMVFFLLVIAAMRSSRMGKRMESKGKIRRRTAGQELGIPYLHNCS